MNLKRSAVAGHKKSHLSVNYHSGLALSKLLQSKDLGYGTH
jgi:hypothetical protein